MARPSPPEVNLMASPANHLLAALPADEFVRIAHELEPVELRRRESVWAVGDHVGHVYFPASGAVAMVVTVDGGNMLETGLIGREGLVGLEPFFGLTTASRAGMVLLPGTAHRMTAAAFAALCRLDTPFHQAVRRYAGARMAAIAQSALCDATHSIRQRCVRRLLALHDAAAADQFPLTQQVLSTLLGVRRASVSVAAERLQEAGLIVYEHGRMRVADRPGLERVACGCYQQLRSLAGRMVEHAGA
jgi:CRP-like cAMP-binding protein